MHPFDYDDSLKTAGGNNFNYSRWKPPTTAISGSGVPLPTPGDDGDVLSSYMHVWGVNRTIIITVGGVEVKYEGQDYPYSLLSPFYFSMVGNDGGDDYGIWLDPHRIAVSAPGEGPSDQGVNITRYQMRIQDDTSYSDTNTTGYIEALGLGVSEHYYDPNTGYGFEYSMSAGTSELQMYRGYWDDNIDLESYNSLDRNSLNMYYYEDNSEDEFELYMQLDKWTSTLHFDDKNGTLNIYTDRMYLSDLDSKSLELHSRNGLSFSQYISREVTPGNWIPERVPTIIYGPTQINYGDMWINTLASGIEIANYEASVKILPHEIPVGAIVKNVGGKLVGVTGYTGSFTGTDGYTYTYEAGLLLDRTIG